MANRVSLPKGYSMRENLFQFLNDLWARTEGRRFEIFNTESYDDFVSMMQDAVFVIDEEEKVVLWANPIVGPWALVHGLFFTRDVFAREAQLEIRQVLRWLKEEYGLSCIECRIDKGARALARLLEALGYVRISEDVQEWGGKSLAVYRLMEV